MSNEDSGYKGRRKRKRTSYNIDFKLELIRRKQGGERVKDIARSLNIPETTVHTILKKSKEIEAKAACYPFTSDLNFTRQRSEAMEIMEKRLSTWIDGLNAQNIPITINMVQEKALSFYDAVSSELGVEAVDRKPFIASRGWFHRFQRRQGLRHMRTVGELACMDVEVVPDFPTELREIIKGGNYSLKQVFNVDETGLYWKRMPSCTYIMMRENSTATFKASKDRLTLLIGGNANGDKKLKPLLVYRSENPRALKNVAKASLPVIWKSQRKAWVTRQIFRDWFVEYFVPEMKKYCKEEKMEFKILLILDGATAHMLDFESLSENIKVMFIPPQTTAILQPMDQGLIRLLKTHYMRKIFKKLLAETDTSDVATVIDFWDNFNIMECVKLVAESWKEVNNQQVNGCWRNALPEAVNTQEDLNFIHVYSEIAELAKKVGFSEVSEDHITELLESHSVPLTEEELAELDQQTLEEAKNDDEEERMIGEDKTLTIEGLKEFFKKAEEMVEYVKQHDPLYNRAEKFERDLSDVLFPYKVVLRTKRKSRQENSLDSLFSWRTDEAQPVPGPSGHQWPSAERNIKVELDAESTAPASPSSSINSISPHVLLHPAKQDQQLFL